MIDPADFVRRWAALSDAPGLTPLPPTALAGLNIDAGSRRLLTEAGLPEDAAPFLSFTAPAGALCTAADLWNLPSSFHQYRVAGSDDVGSPVCMDAETGNIVCLDHERAFAPELMNSSAGALLEFLLVYAELVERVTKLRGEDAWLDGEVTQEEIDLLEQQLGAMDPVALQEDTFWGCELARLRASAVQG